MESSLVFHYEGGEGDASCLVVSVVPVDLQLVLVLSGCEGFLGGGGHVGVG